MYASHCCVHMCVLAGMFVLLAKCTCGRFTELIMHLTGLQMANICACPLSHSPSARALIHMLCVKALNGEQALSYVCVKASNSEQALLCVPVCEANININIKYD